MLVIISIVIFTFIICFTISHTFLSFYIYEDRNNQINYKNDIFSYIFAISNILLILIVMEIAEVENFEYFF